MEQGRMHDLPADTRREKGESLPETIITQTCETVKPKSQEMKPESKENDIIIYIYIYIYILCILFEHFFVWSALFVALSKLLFFSFMEPV